jgi:nicotinamide-nucleotide amidase
VTYCNQAKHEMLGVDMQDLLEYGAVSEVVAKAMAMGILAKSQAQIALSVTGVAGPGGGTPNLPVGTVWFAVAREGQVQAYHQYFSGGRVEVRQAAVAFALSQLTVIVSQS